VLSKRIDEVNKAMTAVTTSLKNVPSKGELHRHELAMEEQMQQVANVNTRLTTTMEGYKFSEYSPYDFRRPSTVAGPSGTQYMHPQRQAFFNQ